MFHYYACCKYGKGTWKCPKINLTRSVTDELLLVPKPSSSLFKRSLLYNGPLLWNTLPSNVRSAESLNIFKKLLAAHISQQQWNVFIMSIKNWITLSYCLKCLFTVIKYTVTAIVKNTDCLSATPPNIHL